MRKLRGSQAMSKQRKQVWMLCKDCKALLPDHVPAINLGNGQPQIMPTKHCPNCGSPTQRCVQQDNPSGKVAA